MSAPDPAGTSQPSLLLVIDPAAKLWDGESVRIARDVLCAGAPGVKVCLPESPEEAERALARRGSRRPVVVGDDRALLRAVRLLHRERELDDAVLSVVPVGAEETVALTCGLGVPADAVSAARTVLDGVEQRLGLLIDDSGGVVLGGIRIPEPPGGDGPQGLGGALRAKAALSRARRLAAARVPAQRLRVEADGELLADLDRPVAEVSVTTPGSSSGGDSGPPFAQVTVRPQGADRSGLVRARAKAVTVSGPDFSYRADALVGGPVRVRTWTALAAAWSLTLPA
ncbi:diacylglycerol kinase [Streptomyces winkii]|uniref:diacylglycerol kinase n=1 Tax=Streptomyces winkii TaxID=3051178 RepID=UPI0028D458F8|nr:diacylglycerol kinase [Streptomyces sp. DSM 40971]